ncbi:uncharacterized protein BJ171DRAFT_623623 [Polychytrium aggregatum]|uniref:uncharacterized protein n=1 Tax=Polychytrium aggregatum TaxID=110093 RepID=UPI0022FDB359|nr:uncharacterized protein BJ171DRAFT_623623 [Polychytrium aggregatum]KAI9203405.1 hypothetical protein BJ171DRAFT_623623 [Polychytrium aggregatum]
MSTALATGTNTAANTGQGSCLNHTKPSHFYGNVTLDDYDWASGNITNYIIKIILEEVLGYSVSMVTCPSCSVYNWDGLSNGTVMASLEVWVDASPIRQQILQNRSTGADRTIEDAGPSGVLTQVGWFTQKFALDLYPELASYRGLKANHSAYRYAVPQNLWAQSEANLINAVTVLTSHNIPALFALYVPHAFFNYYSVYSDSRFKFERVSLPTLVAGVCDVNCADYSQIVVQKLINANLRTTSQELYWFFRQISLTTDDITNVISWNQYENMSDRDAACRWVQENNNSWSKWIWFRNCDNDCSNHGYCEFSQCYCDHGWTGSNCGVSEDVFEIPLFAFMGADAVALVTVYLYLRHKNPYGHNTFVFTIGITLLKAMADIMFWVRYAGFSGSVKEDWYFIVGITTLAAPTFMSLIGIIITIRNARKLEDFEEYYNHSPFTVQAFTLLSSLNPNIILILTSNIMMMDRYNAPLKKAFRKNIKEILD